MNELKISPLAPIRFYPIDYDFEQGTKFQNQDNRVSTGYDWDAVNPYPYHLAIPKQWPDGQPGIDTMVVLDTTKLSSFTAKIYDEDNSLVKSCNVDLWKTIGTDKHYRIWVNGHTATAMDDGLYTIRIFSGSTGIYESEAFRLGTWFTDFFPFEYTNFENDFGLIFDNGVSLWTGRMLLPIRMYDPVPQFEKEIYQNDPGIKTTLRTVPQRVFAFDIDVVPVHVAEAFLLACSCSELYLNRVKVNFEEMPESEIIEGTNLKQITGQSNFVDFNDTYSIERVETAKTDQNLSWDGFDFYLGSIAISGNTVTVNETSIIGLSNVYLDAYTAAAGEIVYITLEVTDNGQMPEYAEIGGVRLPVVAGANRYSVKFKDSGSKILRLYSLTGQSPNYEATAIFYSIEN